MWVKFVDPQLRQVSADLSPLGRETEGRRRPESGLAGREGGQEMSMSRCDGRCDGRCQSRVVSAVSPFFPTRPDPTRPVSINSSSCCDENRVAAYSCGEHLWIVQWKADQ